LDGDVRPPPPCGGMTGVVVVVTPFGGVVSGVEMLDDFVLTSFTCCVGDMVIVSLVVLTPFVGGVIGVVVVVVGVELISLKGCGEDTLISCGCFSSLWCE
jgi:hypothetical protein